MRLPSLHRRRGFTLIEMIVVMFIMALGVSIVVASFSNTLSNTAMKKSLKDLSNVFRYARSRAISKKVKTTVTINLATMLVTVNSPEPNLRLGELASRDEEEEEDDGGVLDFIGENPTPKPGSGDTSKKKQLSRDIQIAFESFFSSDLQLEGTLTIDFFTKGNCKGGIFYISNHRGEGYSLFLDPVTGLPEIGDELMFFDWAMIEDEEYLHEDEG